MKFANAYTLKEEREKSYATVNNEPSMTEQSPAHDADINVIMQKYSKTGQIPRVLAEPMYGDFSNPISYADAVLTVRAAEEAFMQIPAKVRMQFGNDPGEFIKFATNPENKEELKKLGLTKPTPEPTIEQQTLEAIKSLKPQEKTDGSGQK